MGSGCDYCRGEPEPGWIDMPDNGPTVPCPKCNRDYDDDRTRREREFEAALAQRAEQQAAFPAAACKTTEG